MNESFLTHPAPADRKTRTPWSRWTIILAYTLLTAVALGFIWLVDRGAMRVGP